MSQLITFNKQTTVIGKTESGKTYAVKKSLDNVKSAVLFFNTQLIDMPKNYVKATKRNDYEQIKEALANGRKINYMPTTDKELRQKELTFLIKKLYDGQVHNLFFVADECHLFKNEALDMLQEIGTTGNRFGINGIFISQRMQNIDKTLVTQSLNVVMFETTFERSYFNEKGIPYDDIQSRLDTGGKYTYCIFDGKNVSGGFKV